MRSRTAILVLFLGAASLPSIAGAQEWRGGRVRAEGLVTDEKGEPVEGCRVVMRWGKSGHGGPDLTTDKKGRFAIFGLQGGPWDVDFEAPGYQTRKITVTLQEGARSPSIDVRLERAPEKAAAPTEQQILVAGKKISKEAAAAISAGNEAMGSKNWSVARENYLKAASELPDNVALLERIAATYLGEGNAEEAVRYARQAADKDPSDAAAWTMVAEIELQRGNLEAGLDALGKVPAEKISNPQPYLNVGILLLNKKKPAQAESAFDRAIAIKPDLADAYYYRGLCRLQEKKNAGARDDLRKALELAPDAPDAKDIRDLLKTLQ